VTLYDVPLFRDTDPRTSIEAGEQIRPHLPRMQAAVLAQLARWHNGATAYQIATELGRQQGSVAKRLSDLHAAGFVCDTGTTRPGSSRQPCIVWAVTVAGRKAAA
jgi:DNA-binding MarR family transcriptional regulator